LFNDFTTAFDKADRIVILPVYAVSGREGDSISVNAEHLAGALVRRGLAARFAASFRQAATILKKELTAGDVCLLMGAGDIVKIHKYL
jgi:UDP-N-acetylmuramate-alanine ligase